MRTTLLLLLVMAGPLASCGQNRDWPALKEEIRAAYPEVRMLATDSLAAWLASTSPPPRLLDIRTEAEYAVSHLRDAHRLDPDATVFAALHGLATDTPIVTYCSVGYRSAEMARRLHAAGFTDVANLEGSLFAWANEGRPVYLGDRVVHRVHPYNEAWGRLLNPALHAYTP